MPPLAELQTTFFKVVMTCDAPAGLFAGRVPPQQTLAIHRGTVIGALTQALRLSCPTVDALVGTTFFDQACHIFAEQNLPKSASLTDYGKGFAAFLAGFVPTLAYLPDVARLDRAIEAVLRAPIRLQRFKLDDAVSIDLPQSLRVLALTYPADVIRAELDDDAAMAAIDLAPAPRFVLVRRQESEAVVRQIDPAAGLFLQKLLAGESTDAALQAAMTQAGEAQALGILQADIFAAPFCTVISNPEIAP